jgi:translation initiation factor 2-alpha kinase 4
MYSVGIIFFEMCYAFKTGMERVATITALRQPDVQFPVAWPSDLKPKQREIISLLLRHNPDMRPQATQLLDGPLVPSPDVERRMYDGLITEITNPRSEKYPDLVDALFASHANAFGLDTRIDDFTYDNSHDDGHHVWQSVVMSRIAEIFQRHGAVDDYLPLLVPETTLLNVFPDLKPVRLMDHNGKFVQLPASNLLRMARSASRRQIERIKRYNISLRYAELASGGQPQACSELW